MPYLILVFRGKTRNTTDVFSKLTHNYYNIFLLMQRCDATCFFSFKPNHNIFPAYSPGELLTFLLKYVFFNNYRFCYSDNRTLCHIRGSSIHWRYLHTDHLQYRCNTKSKQNKKIQSSDVVFKSAFIYKYLGKLKLG